MASERLFLGYRTEVRTRWTKNNLYFLFVCPYEELHLKPAPNTQKETNELWNWDVAEVFVGSDFKNSSATRSLKSLRRASGLTSIST